MRTKKDDRMSRWEYWDMIAILAVFVLVAGAGAIWEDWDRRLAAAFAGTAVALMGSVIFLMLCYSDRWVQGKEGGPVWWVSVAASIASLTLGVAVTVALYLAGVHVYLAILLGWVSGKLLGHTVGGRLSRGDDGVAPSTV